jgi:hypothetical protein
MGDFTASLGMGGPGTTIPEFCALVKIITRRHGKKVMIGECDENGWMHFSKGEKHLGYIDIRTGSLVWDGGRT